MMTMQEAIAYINAHTWSQWKLGLERTEELLRRLGDPQKGLRFIHVAGSNGKGSTCAMLEAVLRAAGFKTGMYPSPYIEDFRERIQVNGEWITKQALCEITQEVRAQADAMADHPSQFELITAIGMVYFARCACDIVVLEVGLGGTFDSTNVIDAPEVAVITSIGLEHTEYLGDTLAEIAAAKGGIIKTGADVVCLEGAPEVMEVIAAICREKGCALHIARRALLTPLARSLYGQRFRIGANDYTLSLIGEYQLYNAATVYSVVEVLRKRGFAVPEKAVKEGFAAVRWPARFEVLCHAPLLILDGGHNPQCAEALAASLDAYGAEIEAAGAEASALSGAELSPAGMKEELSPAGAKAETSPIGKATSTSHGTKTAAPQVTFLIGILGDKDIASVLRTLSPYGTQYICVTPESDRAMPAEKLRDLLRAQGKRAEAAETAEDALRRALDTGRPVVAFGSLYMAGALRRQFRAPCKDWQRRAAGRRRLALTAEERHAKSRLICEALKTLPEIQRAKTIFSYMALPEEADLLEFHCWALEKGKRLAFPISERGGRMYAAIPAGGRLPGKEGADGWTRGAYGILSPEKASAEILSPAEIDVVLTPCVAFDGRGGRMGHGAGYYDRYLAACPPETTPVLIAFEAQRLPEITRETTDVPIGKTVTEDGVFESGGQESI